MRLLDVELRNAMSSDLIDVTYYEVRREVYPRCRPIQDRAAQFQVGICIDMEHRDALNGEATKP